ncbi:ABC transporter substrate-binding protein [Phytohabitans rumicis]|uniref:ABC transporter substrate-binding protein n=1 Tax=Phytohabitans rumicis TaxID=1076125 RepID=A0A6V8LCL7_9ACTN|nr:ABC transporter substrate-binding protein [Phytohabitans rumicis]GFJ94983.1 ABC transporter substrate-binding protein [Phytohabitans rumicis]
MRNRLRYLAALTVVGLLAACQGGDGKSNTSGGQYPRNETLYTSGTLWGPPTNWNPLVPGGLVTGTEGLVYEPLFLFDPETLKLEPWLAEKGEWSADKKQYTVTLRDGVKWGDGKPFTADDVKFTLEVGKAKAVPYSNIWNWVSQAEAVDARTVRVTFSDPRVQEWENWLYQRAMLPKHIWESRSEADLTSHKNEKPVGTGAYEYSTHGQDRMVWKKKSEWWATKALGLEVKPTYVVDIVNSSNEVALGLLTSGRLDLSNNFLPGVANLVKGDFHIKTYYAEPPYMIPINTAMLIPNTTKAPLNDAAFRKALAQAIDTKKIAEGVYGNIVKAANPTGLLPFFDQYVDQATVSQSGFSYDTGAAKSTLAGAGYRDANGDGKVEAPGGKAIALKLIVPSGWTDWMEAARVIAEGAQAAGINVVAEFPDSAAVDDARTTGKFDLLLNNWTEVSNTPWTYYNYIYQLPVQKQQFAANFSRYQNPQAWNLVQKLARTASDDPAYKTTIADLQKVHLAELPAIPLWYNGLWAQFNDSVWTNWPSSAQGAPKSFPCTWNNIWELGAVKTLTQIKPVAAK